MLWRNRHCNTRPDGFSPAPRPRESPMRRPVT
jgi:hypothetical protein